MADTGVVTSEVERWDIQDFFHGANHFKVPEEVHFLGGAKSSLGIDYDLYYLRYIVDDEVDQELSLCLRYSSEADEWDHNDEECEDVDQYSDDVMILALNRAKERGLYSPKFTLVERHLERGREHIPYIPHRKSANFLGACHSDNFVYELFFVPEETDGGHRVEGVYAVQLPTPGSGDAHVYAWPNHGHLPIAQKGIDEGPTRAIYEALHMSQTQGFGMVLKDCCEQKLAEVIGGGPVPTEELHASEAVDIIKALLGKITGNNPTRNDALVKELTEFSNREKATNMNTVTTEVTNDTIVVAEKNRTKKFTNVSIVDSKDEQIHLPPGMTKAQARDWLTQIEKNEEQVIRWSETIDAYPLDGALALRRVFERRFGKTVKASATEKGFFGTEFEVPPYMIQVETGFGTQERVPWGNFNIPLIPEHKISSGVEFKNNQYYFRMHAEVKRKYQPLLDEIAAQVQEEVRQSSIYKNKAFRLKFPNEQEDAMFNPNEFAPKFMDVSTTNKLILSSHVQEQIDTSLFTPVAHTALCRKHGIPLKRGILLEGKYGTGKTLTASLLAKLCTEKEWTFIYLEDVKDLEKAMRFARRYEPAVIFSEDIDSVMQMNDSNERDEAMNKILNTIDGVDMKKVEQMVVLTTNYVSKISKAMLRPGRLDAVISVEPPNEEAVIQLMKHYAAGLLDNESSSRLQPAAELLTGQIPSVVREVVERSKLSAIRRASTTNFEGGVTITGDDILIAAKGISMHIKLLEDPEADNRSDIEKAAAMLGDKLAAVLVPSTPTNGSSGKSLKSGPSVKSLPAAD